MATIAFGMQAHVDCTPAVSGHDRARDETVLHRIAEVRAQQGLSLRAISRRTGLEVRELKQQELATSDLTLSELYRWAEALEVPVDNLLVDHDQDLSASVRTRAALVKAMKTVVAMSEVTTSPRVARLAEMLREQLMEIMPELADVGGWPSFGSRRPPDHVGRIAAEPIRVDNLSLE